MSQGLGSLSSFGVATQQVNLVPQTGADVYLPITGESVTSNRNPVPSASIVGDSMVQAVADGVVSVEGGFQMEMDGSVSGQAIWLFNGNTGYTVVQLGSTYGMATVAPTATPAAGGNNAIGVYRYRVSTVLRRGTYNRPLIMPATPSVTATTAGSNLLVNVGWANPSALLPNHTQYGTIIWRSIVGGGANSEVFLAFVAGTATTYADTGSVALSTAVFYTASLYEHTMIGSPPVTGDRLTAFTYFGKKNNDFSERYSNCRMDAMKIGVGGMGEKMMLDFSLKGTGVDLISNFTPSFVPLEPFVGWHAKGSIDGQVDCSLENFEIQCNNGVQVIPGLCETQFNHDTISGQRAVSLQFSRQFTDHNFWTRMINGAKFSVNLTSFGQSLQNGVNYYVPAAMSGNALDMVPFQYAMTIDLFDLKANKAGGNTSGMERIMETVNAMAFKDATQNTEMRIRLYNSVAAYV
jgi:hypothetical protein